MVLVAESLNTVYLLIFVFRCSREIQVPFAKISACSKGGEGNVLHKLAGDRTHALSPRVTFIPTIELDGEQFNQRSVRRNFAQQLCKTYKVFTRIL